MDKTVLKSISVVCITGFSCFLLHLEHPYLAIAAEILGLSIIFDAVDKLEDLFW